MTKKFYRWTKAAEKTHGAGQSRCTGMSEHAPVLIYDLLVKELKDVDYHKLGTHLGLSPGDLRTIERDYHLDTRRRSEVLDLWMRRESNPTWEKIIVALEEMKELALASQLKRRHAGPAHKGDLQGTEITLPRNEKIAKELEELERQHFNIVAEAELVLTRINPPSQRIRRFSRTYMAGVNASSVEELFDKMNELSSCLHYSLLENIIELFLKTTTVADRFSKYCERVEQFKRSTTVQQFMGSIEKAQGQTSTKREELETSEKSQAQTGATKEGVKMCTVTICLVGGWLPMTIKDLDILIKEIFQGKSSVLAHIKILPGSVVVTYLAPQSEITSLAELAIKKKILMPKVGIGRIQIGAYSLKFNENSSFSFESSLVEAAKNNDFHLLEFLLNLNTTVDAADEKKQTALFWASCNGHFESVDLLLEANANPNCQRVDGTTPLHIACKNGHLLIVECLLTAKANPKCKRNDGMTPLNLAHRSGHTAIVSLLNGNTHPIHCRHLILIWLVLILLGILYLCK